jgi:hypothetical protein
MGLAGTPHCAAMCGAPCAALTGGRSPGTVLAFHLARVASYAIGGAVAAASMGALASLSQFSPAVRPLWTLLHALALALGMWLLWHGRQPAWMGSFGRVTRTAPAAGTTGAWQRMRGPVRAAAGWQPVGGLAMRAAAVGPAGGGHDGQHDGRGRGYGQLRSGFVGGSVHGALDLAALSAGRRGGSAGALGGAWGGAPASRRVGLGPVTWPLAPGGGVLRNPLATAGGSPSTKTPGRPGVSCGRPWRAPSQLEALLLGFFLLGRGLFHRPSWRPKRQQPAWRLRRAWQQQPAWRRWRRRRRWWQRRKRSGRPGACSWEGTFREFLGSLHRSEATPPTSRSVSRLTALAT